MDKFTALGLGLGLIVGLMLCAIDEQKFTKPATATQPPGPVTLLAVTRCGQLAGYVAVWATGKTQVLPALQAKPGTRFQAIEVGQGCGKVTL